MLRIKVDVPPGLKDAAQVLGEEMKHALDLSTGQLEEDAKRLVPVRTGNLQRAITSDVISLGGAIRGVVYPNMKPAPYAADVEFGTGLYSEHPQASKGVIRPKNKKALAFMLNGSDSRPTTAEGWRQAVRDGRAMVVPYIKGMHAHPYMRPTFEAGKQKVEENFRAAIQRAKERMAK